MVQKLDPVSLFGKCTKFEQNSEITLIVHKITPRINISLHAVIKYAQTLLYDEAKHFVSQSGLLGSTYLVGPTYFRISFMSYVHMLHYFDVRTKIVTKRGSPISITLSKLVRDSIYAYLRV